MGKKFRINVRRLMRYNRMYSTKLYMVKVENIFHLIFSSTLSIADILSLDFFVPDISKIYHAEDFLKDF